MMPKIHLGIVTKIIKQLPGFSVVDSTHGMSAHQGNLREYIARQFAEGLKSYDRSFDRTKFLRDCDVEALTVTDVAKALGIDS